MPADAISRPRSRQAPARLRRLLAALRKAPPPPLSREDAEALWCGTPSGYRNVYAAGPSSWVAKVKEGGVLYTLRGSARPHPRQCAAFVAAYYRARFGRRWREALANRKRPFWRARFCPALYGVVLTVWQDGKARAVRAHGGGPPVVFPDARAAAEYAKRSLPGVLPRPAWRAA